MWSIEPHREVITKYSVTVTLDEDEITKLLVNPQPFLAQLRSIRAQWHRRQIFLMNGHASTRKKVAQRAKKNEAGRLKRGWRCPKCHRIFKSPGRHLATCRGLKDPLALQNSPGDE